MVCFYRCAFYLLCNQCIITEMKFRRTLSSHLLKQASHSYSSSSNSNTTGSMLILSESNVKQCLDMNTCLAANRIALIAVATGTAMVPSRLVLPYCSNTPRSSTTTNKVAADFSLFKPASLMEQDNTKDNTPNNTSSNNSFVTHMGIKIVSVRSQNPFQNLPLVPASILHLNPRTGIVEAHVAGTYLTAMRTACSSALAVQCKLQQSNNPSRLSIVLFGAGLQAYQHIHAIYTAVISKDIPSSTASSSSTTTTTTSGGPLHLSVTIINRTMGRAQQLAHQLHMEQWWCDRYCTRLLELSDHPGVAQALAQANIICTCTNTVTPLWDDEMTKHIPKDCIITGIGSYTPDMCEVPQSTVDQCDHIWIDTPEAHQVGDLKHLMTLSDQQKLPTVTLLGDVLQQQQSCNKYCCTGRIFFKGVGTAIQDVLTADVVVQRAREMQIGIEVDMS